jgi:hypothetical protein
MAGSRAPKAHNVVPVYAAVGSDQPCFRRESMMMGLRVRTLLAATIVAAIPGMAAAQFPPPPPPPSRSDRPQTLAPKSQPPQAKTEPNGAGAAAAPKPKPKIIASPNVVTCSGVFAKDSTHLKLALKYDSRNVVYGQVDGADGSKLNASIVFPNDPKRRLEVLWNNEAARSDTSVISINGKSQWIAPKGLKLGLAIAALEKANGRPFKLTGFGKDGSASVAGWENGALSSLPGGCKVGIRLFVDSKTPEPARSAVTGDAELRSNDARVRAVKPTVGEILIGY